MSTRVPSRFLRFGWLRATLLALSVGYPGLLQAQTAPDVAQDGEWHFRLVPYFWAAGIEGTASVTGVNEVPIEASFSDVISNFDIGLLGAFEARRDRFGIGVDLMYLNLGADVPAAGPILGRLDLQADVRQVMTEGVFFYRARSGGREDGGYLDLLLGVRYTGTSTQLKASGPAGGDLEGTKRTLDWLDGLAGARFRLPLGSRAGLTGRGDVAGLGSDFTWSARAGLDLALGSKFASGLDYRWLDIDYDSGEGLDRRIFKLRYSGPYIWLAYSW